MSTLPPEIFIAIINALTAESYPNAYTFSSNVKATLHSLGLVNSALHEWSTETLYSRITVADDQIARLRATLTLNTPRALSLAKRIRILRLAASKPNLRLESGSPSDVNADSDSFSTQDGSRYLTSRLTVITEATALIHLLAPNATLKRLFVDMSLTRASLHNDHSQSGASLSLQAGISSLTSLSELVLGNHEDDAHHFFWLIELERGAYDCFTRIHTLTILDANIIHPPAQGILAQFVNLKELILVRPWITHLQTGGGILAELFDSGRAQPLQRLTIVLASGWRKMSTQILRVEDLGAMMIPHRDKVLIVPDRPLQLLELLPSWEAVQEFIGMGYQWGQQEVASATSSMDL
ncbi:hypothetical protein FRB95_006346 [Tulasnella sp. JGI-2019a]|nr:hypothetical protein FRB95_006346 [Tulasnella sp. JGI-2019a]